MPAERTVCRACAALTYKHCRRNAGRTSSARARRMIERPGRREAALGHAVCVASMLRGAAGIWKCPEIKENKLQHAATQNCAANGVKLLVLLPCIRLRAHQT